MNLYTKNIPVKVVVLGPESTGKSSLCQSLSEYFHAPWCPEYAREYLNRHGNKYSYEDLLVIARGQINGEEESLQEAIRAAPGRLDKIPLLFIDTNMYVMKVWSEFVFGKCHPFILEQIGSRTYDLYLLCNTDLPWVKDELREYPDLKTRQQLFGIYKKLMAKQHVPWKEINGTHEERIQRAIGIVEEFMRTKQPPLIQ